MVEFNDLSKIDPALIAKEVQALREDFSHRAINDAFTYRNFSHDLNLLLDDLVRDEPANPLNLGLYGVAEPFLEDCYFEKGALEPLVKIYGTHRYQLASTFERLLQHLVEAERDDLIERLWTSVARKSRAAFFYQRPGRDDGGHDRVEQFKNDALEGYAQAIAWMTRLGRIDAAAKLAEERDALREERVLSLPAPSNRRRIDEPVFWEIISKVRSEAPTTFEQLAVLGAVLRTFEAGEIKRFGALYARYMKKLYHWSVWALAYAARGGCSDAAFEEFRTWLILQGDPALVALAVADPTQAAERVPPEPDLPDGTCLPTIEEAYLLRTGGSSLELPLIDLDKPKGKEWSEAAFATTYPQLVRHYSSVKEL